MANKLRSPKQKHEAIRASRTSKLKTKVIKHERKVRALRRSKTLSCVDDCNTNSQGKSDVSFASTEEISSGSLLEKIWETPGQLFKYVWQKI